MSEENKNGIITEVTKSEITLDEIYVSQYQKKGSKTARLRQLVKTVTTYPAIKVANEMQDNLFSINDFDTENKSYTKTENRIAFMNVPEKATPEQVNALLASVANTSVIYRVISNHPILTDDQKIGIERGLTTKDIIANRQVVRHGENAVDDQGVKLEGIILDKHNKPQYKENFFKATIVPDVDLRTDVLTDFYATPEIVAEMTGATAMQGQTV